MSLLRSSWEELRRALHEHRRVLVAFSGGCDSAFLLAAARRELGKEAVFAVTAVSPSLAGREKKMAEELADSLDVQHRFVETQEMQNPSYTANPSNRCFYCKDELFATLAPLAEKHQSVLVDGFNASDRSDIRPGLIAAKAWKVRHPLDEANLSKQAVRILSRWMGLPTWNKPASPCLSSRIPYGKSVSETVLRQIEQAEDVLHAEGFLIVRVRHYGTEARIEVPLDALPRLTQRPLWQKIEREIHSCGFQTVVADPRGFQSGRLNQLARESTH